MYYISTENKVYVQCPKGYREVRVTKDENEVINIKDLKEVANIECKEACTLNEVVARYLAKEEVIEETKEEAKLVKKAKK